MIVKSEAILIASLLLFQINTVSSRHLIPDELANNLDTFESSNLLGSSTNNNNINDLDLTVKNHNLQIDSNEISGFDINEDDDHDDDDGDNDDDDNGDDNGDHKHLRDPPPTSILVVTQLFIASLLGLSAVLAFSVMRCRFPNIYMARLNYLSVSNRKFMPPIINTTSLFNWIPIIYKITDQEVLQFAGLDAYVFLGFFKMCIKLLSVCLFFSFTIISPIRYYFTGKYDQGGDDDDGKNGRGHANGTHPAYTLNSLYQSTSLTNPQTDSPSGFFESSDFFDPADFKTYLWVYVIFTYVFTLVTQYFLLKQTKDVIKYRQQVLGNQNSITDRTIRLSGIPPELRDERVLKTHIESLNIGKVSSIVICKEWKKLNLLFTKRQEVVEKLELYWSEYLGTKKKDVFNIRPFISSSYALTSSQEPDGNHHFTDNINNNNNNSSNDNESNIDLENNSYHDDADFNNLQDNLDRINLNSTISNIYRDFNSNNDHQPERGYSDYDDGDANNEQPSDATYANDNSVLSNSASIHTSGSSVHNSRPLERLGWLGLYGKKVDAIDYYTKQLKIIDEEILIARDRHYPATPTAFVTMDSVATAQMVAQAVLDPRVHFLITRLAPSPKDIIWENVTLPRKDRLIKVYYITIITGIFCVAFILPVSYLATLLNLKTISTFWPELGHLLKKNQWAQRFVTELLPVYLFTLLNFLIPYLYVWLSSKQGFVSYGEEELSVVSKNFFYVFVNMFLVFTMAGTASNYWGYLSDSKRLALQLATSLRNLSSFYVDTIILQGFGMMPFKLLLFGQLIRFPYFKASCKTPRHYRDLYKPPLFNFGLQLPHPLLILIITLLYSVMSTKILSAGLAYFIIGYFVFKYQLLYSCNHPQHSTGKVWPIIFRRVVMGLLIFQLTVAGSLTLQNAYILAIALTPLPIFTIFFLWNFQKNYLPLSFFIALRAIKDPIAEVNFESSGVSEADSNGSRYANSATPASASASHVASYGASGSNNSNNEFVTPSSTPSSSNYSSSTTKPHSRNSKANKNNKDSSAGLTTIDERREVNQTYEYPYLYQTLDGPWLAIEGEQTLIASDDGLIRKKFTFEDF